jgi:hypothetical protein
MLVHTGPGMYHVVVDRPNVFSVCLYNFDIDGDAVKDGHRQILFNAVYTRFLREGGSAAILGLASTTSNRNWDLELSRRRAQAVESYLRQTWMSWHFESLVYSGPLHIAKVDWEGKDLPLRLGYRDSVESPFWRSVWVRAWDHVATPLVKDILEDMTLPPDLASGGFFLPEAGQALDVLSWTSALTLAEAVPVLDMAISLLDTIAALPVAWSAGDRASYINGYIVGYNFAMKDMADAYANASLDRTAESQWPALIKPTPHWINRSQDNVGQQEAHRGEQEGCDKAYATIQQMEGSPKTYTFDLKDGSKRRVRMTGRRYLRILRSQYGDNVGAYFMLRFNEEVLKPKGMKPYPTTG